MNFSRLTIGFLIISALFACSKSEEAPAAPEPTATDVVFYTDTDWGCGEITITFNEVEVSQKLNVLFPDGVTCGSGSGVIISDVAFGTYPFTALSVTGCQWEGQVTVNDALPCVQVAIGRSNEIASVCDGWVKELSCIEIVAIDSIDINCGFGEIKRYPRMTIKNNCTTAQKVVLCSSTFVTESLISPEGLEPGALDTFQAIGITDFATSPIFAIDKAKVDQYNCELRFTDCN